MTEKLNLGDGFFSAKGEETKPAPTATPPQDEPPKKEETVDQGTPSAAGGFSFDDFTQAFQGYVGIPFDSFMGTYSQMVEDYQSRQEDRFKGSLRTKLGEDGFDDRYSAINKRFSEMPQANQDKILGYIETGLMTREDAALMIHETLVKEAQANQAPETPGLDSSTDSSAATKRTWKESEVIKLSPDEYREKEKEIDLARQEGRFIKDFF